MKKGWLFRVSPFFDGGRGIRCNGSSSIAIDRIPRSRPVSATHDAQAIRTANRSPSGLCTVNFIATSCTTTNVSTNPGVFSSRKTLSPW
jgi:hypothetical protein